MDSLIGKIWGIVSMYEPACYSRTSCSLGEVDPDVYKTFVNLEIAEVGGEQVNDRVYRLKLEVDKKDEE